MFGFLSRESSAGDHQVARAVFTDTFDDIG